MYFLEKLCRICVQVDVPLVDINTVDFDSVKLSEKLEVCAKMAISKDTISSDICEKCVNKLRVSYHFLDMCKKSTKIIQGYLEKLLGTENAQHNFQNLTYFENSELTTVIEKLPDIKVEKFGSEYNGQTDNSKYELEIENKNESEKDYHNALSLYGDMDHQIRQCRKKPRITKEQRCSLLKRLLDRPKKERDKPVFTHNIHNMFDYEKGGLQNIIDFAKNYEFSFKLDKNSNIESTPLDKLTAFSTNYFRRDFTEFKNHVLYIIENRDRFENCIIYSSDDEDFLSETEMEDEIDERRNEMLFEEVMVEPDIKIKDEVMDCEDEESQCPLDYLETTFEEEESKIRKEEPLSDSENEPLNNKLDDFTTTQRPHFYGNRRIKEEIDSPPKGINGNNILDPLCLIQPNYKSTLSIDSSPAVKLLDKLVQNYPMGSRKVFSATNVRCRTRDHPYINPLLKDQFLRRSFKCERCNRYFKSQGYLKAHTSKVH